MAFFGDLPTIITFIFSLTILSYYILLFMKQEKPKQVHKFASITIIIPAHNEEEYIAEAIESVINAEFDGKKQIIVVDDGSIDKTYEIASKYTGIKVIRTKHSGKSNSLNKALSYAKGDIIAIVDGDSCINKDALKLMTKEGSINLDLSDEVIDGACVAHNGQVRLK